VRSARALGQSGYTVQYPGVVNGSSTFTAPCCYLVQNDDNSGSPIGPP
jgi:hypothetical protein